MTGPMKKAVITVPIPTVACRTEADDNADYIGGDAKILELEPGVGVQVQGDDIVGGHAQICCEIQSGSQADEKDTRHKKDAFQSEAGMGEEGVPDPAGELGHIAQ